MARKGWDELSSTYRKRLINSGVTRQQYDTGHSLRKARGHEFTPEHPEQAYKAPDRFQQYLQKHYRYEGPSGPGPSYRARLVSEIQAIKFQLFGHRPKWNARNSRLAIEKRPDGTIRSQSDLERILEELENAYQNHNRDDVYWRWDNIMDTFEYDDDYAAIGFYH